MFQNPDHQIFNASVREEIAVGPRNLGAGAAEVERRVEESLVRFELEDCADRQPAALSFALRRAVAVAAVFAMDTPILVLDEPSAGLDARHVGRLLARIEERRARGHSVVLVTHDMHLVAEHVPRCAVMHEGRVNRRRRHRRGAWRPRARRARAPGDPSGDPARPPHARHGNALGSIHRRRLLRSILPPAGGRGRGPCVRGALSAQWIRRRWAATPEWPGAGAMSSSPGTGAVVSCPPRAGSGARRGEHGSKHGSLRARPELGPSARPPRQAALPSPASSSWCSSTTTSSSCSRRWSWCTCCTSPRECPRRGCASCGRPCFRWRC